MEGREQQGQPEEQRFHNLFGKEVAEASKDDPIQGGLQVKLLDKMISSLSLEEIEVDVWMEDESDICLHILPSGGALAFDNYREFVRPQMDRIFAKVFGGAVDGAMCEEFGLRHGDANVSRKSDRSRKGMDLFMIRLIGLWKRPHAEKRVVEAVRLLDQVLTGKASPVDG